LLESGKVARGVAMMEHLIQSAFTGAVVAAIMFVLASDNDRVNFALMTFVLVTVIAIFLGNTDVNCAAYPSRC
jgi:hypothetical protein